MSHPGSLCSKLLMFHKSPFGLSTCLTLFTCLGGAGWGSKWGAKHREAKIVLEIGVLARCEGTRPSQGSQEGESWCTRVISCSSTQGIWGTGEGRGWWHGLQWALKPKRDWWQDSRGNNSSGDCTQSGRGAQDSCFCAYTFLRNCDRLIRGCK